MSLPSVSLPHRPVIAMVCLFTLALAACAPSATPTPTAVPPTDAPEEVATTAPTEASDEVETEEATEVETEAIEATEEETAVEAGTEEPTDEADAEGTTEAEGEDEAEGETNGGAEVAGEGFPATVSVSTTRLREAPNSDAVVIVELPQGTAVTVIGRTANSSYAYIVADDGTEGWVAMQTLRLANLFANPPVMTPEG